MIIVDTMNLLMKAYHGYKRLNTEGKFPVSMMYGSIRMLLALYERYPRTLHFTLEGRNGASKRKEFLPEYKASRKAKPLVDLMIAEALIMLQCIPSFWYKGDNLEADDIIADLVGKNKDTEKEIFILSSDKDLWSLIGSNVYCIGLKSKMTTEEDVQKKFGVPISKIILHKCVFGDPSDEIPRIPRERSKKMMEWLEASKDFKTLLEVVPEKFHDHIKKNYEVVKFQKDSYQSEESAGSLKDLQEHLYQRNCPSLVDKVEEFFKV